MSALTTADVAPRRSPMRVGAAGGKRGKQSQGDQTEQPGVDAGILLQVRKYTAPAAARPRVCRQYNACHAGIEGTLQTLGGSHPADAGDIRPFFAGAGRAATLRLGGSFLQE